MKITPLTIDFDVTNEKEVEFVNDLMGRLFGGAPLKTTAAPAESPVTSTSVPTFGEPTRTAAPVREPRQETVTGFGKPVKEAPQATLGPEPAQDPVGEEEAPDKPLTAKDMQAFMIDSVKTGKITRPQLTDIMLEFGGASLMRIKPEKYELLKQRIETYND